MKFNNQLILLFFSLLFITITACKTVKTSDGTTLRVRSASFLVKKLEQQKLDVEWMTAKVKLRLSENGSTTRASADIRMRKDSVIWMTVKKFGIEGARVLITTDSIYLINRLEREYLVQDFSFIESEFNLPASFQTLQDFILGNVFFMTQENIKSDINDDAYHLTASDPTPFTNEYWLDATDFNLEKMYFNDLRYQRELTVEQSEYLPVGEIIAFPHRRVVETSSQQLGNVSVEMDLSRVKFNQPANMPFKKQRVAR